MTPEQMAALHARCFTVPRPYTQAEFTRMLAAPTCVPIFAKGGFALAQIVADQAEIVTLAVDPDRRRQGTGTALVATLLDIARARGAASVFLEVAEGNTAAIALYHAAGFRESGRRRGYFRPPDRPPRDALLMTRALAPASPE